MPGKEGCRSLLPPQYLVELKVGFCTVVVACRNIGLWCAGNFIMSRSASNLANSLRSWTVVKAFHKKSVTMPTHTMAPMRPKRMPT